MRYHTNLCRVSIRMCTSIQYGTIILFRFPIFISIFRAFTLCTEVSVLIEQETYSIPSSYHSVLFCVMYYMYLRRPHIYPTRLNRQRGALSFFYKS